MYMHLQVPTSSRFPPYAFPFDTRIALEENKMRGLLFLSKFLEITGLWKLIITFYKGAIPTRKNTTNLFHF
jgi:hypothetical protein